MHLQPIRIKKVVEVSETSVADSLIEGDGLGIGGRIGFSGGGSGLVVIARRHVDDFDRRFLVSGFEFMML